MPLLLDADGLIKLHRAGILAQVARLFTCIVPSEVYQEVVTQGKERWYADAREIEDIVNSGAISRLSTPAPQLEAPGLGSGEKGVLGLFSQVEGAIIVSDDRRFLTLLDQMGISSLTPAALIVLMDQQGHLAMGEARGALERLRPFIRGEGFTKAMQALR